MSNRSDVGGFTAREAALRIGVNERTVRRAIARGELPAVKRGGVFWIDAAALADFRLRRSPGRAAAARSGIPVPAPPTLLVGRDDAVAAAQSLFADGARLITLTGPGGVGKTRLGLAVAAAIASRMADGAVFVPLEAIRDSGLVPGAIARALGVEERGDRPVADALLEAVARRRQLVVLDNFEQVLPAAETAARLLAAGPHLRLLVTSRELLRVRGEHELVVPPLALPSAGRPESEGGRRVFAGVVESPAVTLFVQRTKAARAEFALTEENAPLAAKICRRLDGLPLAIELAAVQVKHVSLAELLTRLGNSLDALSGGPRDLPGRLQTMRAAIAWSYDLLAPEEQGFFRRLAVFAGGFDAPAAAAVHEAFSPPEAAFDAGSSSPQRLLNALVDKSLVVEDWGADARPRYRLLETIREFAWEQAEASDERERARTAHAARSLVVAETLAREYHGPGETAALARLDAERDNIRAAFDWAMGEEGDIGLGLRLGNALWWYWYVRGLHREGWRRLNELMTNPEAEAWPLALAHVVLAAGALAMRMLQGDDAEALHREGLARYRRLGDRRGAAFARCCLGYDALLVRGDAASAMAFLKETLFELEPIDDRWLEAAACSGLSLVHLARGELEAAQAWGERALALARADGDAQGMAAVLDNLGQIARRRGDADAALGLFREALRHFERLGDRGNICTCVEASAGLLVSLDHPGHAAKLFGAAAVLRQRFGLPVPQHELSRYEADLVAVRAALDAQTFAEAWAFGEETPLEAVLAAVPWRAIERVETAIGPAAPAADGTTAGLTRREREVLGLVAKGHTDKEIARLLSISPATATKHVGNAARKLGAPSRAAAVAQVVSSGAARER